jgi:uncharacterized protein
MKQSSYNVWVHRDDKSFVFNGVSGALLTMHCKDYDSIIRYLDNRAHADCSAHVMEQLIRGRMLIADDFDELAVLSRRYTVSRSADARFVLTLVTSLGCNFDCPYCFEAKHPSIMNQGAQDAVLRILEDQLPRIKSFMVTWFGGEPLVGKKPLLALSDAFIERCERSGVLYEADITTNGYLLDEDTCRELRDRRITSAQVCLDGPAHIHDRMRPRVNGGGTFRQIVKNLHHAVKYLAIRVRMNVDTQNFAHAEELLQLLAAEGFSGKLGVYAGQIVGVNDGSAAPSETYHASCFTNREFAQASLKFSKIAEKYGFSSPSLPRPTGAPCTAVRENELIVGSKGELYKCFESVGNRLEVIGTVNDYFDHRGRLNKWLSYDPFADSECRSCIALPVCMGGCAHHAMDAAQYENRCGTFRHTYREQVSQFAETAEKVGFSGLKTLHEVMNNIETR